VSVVGDLRKRLLFVLDLLVRLLDWPEICKKCAIWEMLLSFRTLDLLLLVGV